MTRQEFVTRHTIRGALGGRGIELRGKMAKCPFHADSSASMSVDEDNGQWFCHACNFGGGVIDMLARFDGKDVIAFLKDNDIQSDNQPRPTQPTPARSKVVATYQYRNEIGNELFEVVRMEPKTFRQRHRDKNGQWAWGMDGVERVLYRLPEVVASETVALCEGEKDADSLSEIGYCGTCNVGGAGKWLDGYTQSLTNKSVLIFGDNDKAGRDHVELVFNSIAGKVKQAKLVEIPAPFKDVTEFIRSFATKEQAREAIEAIASSSPSFVGGIKLPLYTMAELEPTYTEHVKSLDGHSFNLGKWVGTFRKLRNLVPGSLAMIVGNTGVGKTALLGSIALSASPMETILFEIELPPEDVFERLVAARLNATGEAVEESYRSGNPATGKVLEHQFPRLLICTEPRLTVQQIENYIIKSELKFGDKPKLVLIDYVQLIGGTGNTFERASAVAEDLKRMAKATKTIVIIASQIARPDGTSPEVGLHDAKNSGSLENSCGLVIGAWRSGDNGDFITLKILKATKGGAGLEATCRFHGDKMRIVDTPQLEPQDKWTNDN